MKIKVKGYEYRRSNLQFWCDETETYLIDNCTSIYELNDEVEIIEEDKKIEKLIEPLTSEYTYDYAKKICHKINEIIDKLNEMEKE